MATILPTFVEFKTLLNNDAPFRDHFNLFLQLPVFANRFHYFPMTEQFGVAPAANFTYQNLDLHQVWKWVYHKRLPHFWNSDFYIGYRMCCELMTDESAPYYTKELQKFIYFLRGSPGESFCLFWMDMERLNQSNPSKKELKGKVDKIRKFFLTNGAPFQLEASVRKEILFASTEALSLSEEMAVLRDAQKRVMDSLRDYWYQQYLALVRRCQHETKEDVSDEEEDDTHDRNPILDYGDADFYIPRVKANEKEDLKDSSPVQASTDGTDFEFHELKVSTMFTQSAYNLYSLSNMEPAKVESNQKLEKLGPFIQASLRSSMAVDNLLLQYFLKSTDRFVRRASNLLMFWLSSEMLMTKDEMKRWFSSTKCYNLDSVCPYMSLFDGYPMANDLESLLELYIDDYSEFYIDLPRDLQKQLLVLLPKGLGQSYLIEAQKYALKEFQPFWEEFIVHDNDSLQKECATRKELCRLVPSLVRKESELFHRSQSPDQILFASFDTGNQHSVKYMWRAVEYAESIRNPGLLHLPSRRMINEQYNNSNTTSIRPSPTTDSRGPSPGDVGPITYRGITLNPMITTLTTSTTKTYNKFTRTTIYNSRPAIVKSLIKKKAPIPEEIADIFKSPEHIESFYHFLMAHGNGIEICLVFWLAVEDMKDSIGNERTCTTKIRRIKRRFFRAGADITVHCQDTKLLEVVATFQPSAFQLMDAQEAVAGVLEEHWFDKYVKYLSSDYTEKIIHKGNKALMSTDENSKKPDIKPHSQALWKLFIRIVINFRKGLKDPASFNKFKKYLAREVIKGDTTGKKKLIGKKVVNVTKLLNDLAFWMEVERYKDMADVVYAARHSGSYTPEDEIMVHKKAHAIVNCYIDSTVPPKVQINVPPDTVASVIEHLSSGEIRRGLFHDAALHIFQILILYWKRFRKWAYSPQAALYSVDSESSMSMIGDHNKIRVGGIQGYDSQILVDGCILSFSLRYGLRLIRPSLRKESGFSTIVLATSSKIRCAIPIKGKHQYKGPELDTTDNTDASNEERQSPQDPQQLVVKEETKLTVPATSSNISNISNTGLPPSGTDLANQ